jgi:ABC-type branched-subunit amino acid transport system substrate-binding protein
VNSSARKAIAVLVAVLCAALGASLAIDPALGASGSHTATKPSCKGFKNRIGMTNKVVRLGNAVDLTGPFPGAGTSAQQAARAYVAYFNASGQRICGRKLGLKAYDSKTDANGDEQAYQSMCTDVFGAIGSTSLFDNGGAATAQGCRLPDVRAQAVTSARIACGSCFGVDATWSGEVPNSVTDYFLATHHAATQKAAILYLNLAATIAKAKATQKVAEQRGFKYVYTSAFDLAEFNYAPYVQQLKSKDAQLVEILGTSDEAIRFAQAMQAASYRPEIYLVDGVAYDPGYTSVAVDEGTTTAINHVPLTATTNPELNRYKKWLTQVAPGARPTPQGLYAWSAAKLFTEQAMALGARLTRANLITRLRTVKAWTGGGLHAPQAVGTEHASPCVRFLFLHDGKWISIGGTAYRCSGVTRAG